MVNGLGSLGAERLTEGAALLVRQLAGQLEFRGALLFLCGLLLAHCFGSLIALTRPRIISANSAQSSGPGSLLPNLLKPLMVENDRAQLRILLDGGF